MKVILQMQLLLFHYQGPKPVVEIPDEEKIEEDEDDLTKIKREISKTLSRLEQAEVE